MNLSGANFSYTFPAYSMTVLDLAPALVLSGPSTVTVSDVGGAYRSSAYAATATVNGLASLEGISSTFTYYSGSMATGTPLSGAPVNVGTYTVVASFSGSTDYAPAQSSPATFAITAVPLAITANNQTKAYGAVPPTFTASCAGFVGSDTAASLTTPPTLSTTATAASHVAGSPYAITASGAVDSNYTITYVAGSLNVTPAPLTITANNQNKAYGAALPSLAASYSGFVNGDTPANLTAQPTLLTAATATSPVSASLYPITVNGAADFDYAISFVAGGLRVTQATPTVIVSGDSGTYTGYAFTAADTIAGVVTGVDSNPAPSLEGVPPSLVYYTGTSATGTALSGAPTSAGTYTVLASFAGSTDYTSGTASTTFTISKATPGVSVTDNGGMYTGSAFAATTASLEGITPTLTYYTGTSATGTALSGAPTSASTYTVLASFAGSTDYTSGTASTTFTISEATPGVSVTDNGGTYTGSAFTATTASLEGITPTLTYYTGTSATGTALSGAPTSAGTYTVLASFAGSTDYTSGTASTTFTISKATPGVSVTDNGGMYTGSAFTATTASLEGITPTLTYYTGTSATGTALSGAPTSASTYTVLASFAGSTDYTSGTASTTFTISKATPGVSVTDNGGTYTGSAFAATTASLEGITPTLTYYTGTSATGTALSGAPTSAGTYTVLASFAGSTDYTSGTASTTFTISLSASDGKRDRQWRNVHRIGLHGDDRQPGRDHSDADLLHWYQRHGHGVERRSDFGGHVHGSGQLRGEHRLHQRHGEHDVHDQQGHARRERDRQWRNVHRIGLHGDDRQPGRDHSDADLLHWYQRHGHGVERRSDFGEHVHGSGQLRGEHRLHQRHGEHDVHDRSSRARRERDRQWRNVHRIGLHGDDASLEGDASDLIYYSGTSATGTALSGAPTSAGTYTVLASFAGSTDYTSGTASTTFTIGEPRRR